MRRRLAIVTVDLMTTINDDVLDGALQQVSTSIKAVPDAPEVFGTESPPQPAGSQPSATMLQNGRCGMAPEVLTTSAGSTNQRSRRRNRRQPALIAGAAMIGLLGFSVLAGPGDAEIGALSRYSQSTNTAPGGVPEAGSMGGYAPNSIGTPVVPRAADPPESHNKPARIAIEPRWPGDDFSMGGYAPNIPPMVVTSG